MSLAGNMEPKPKQIKHITGSQCAKDKQALNFMPSGQHYSNSNQDTVMHAMQFVLSRQVVRIKQRLVKRLRTNKSSCKVPTVQSLY